MSRRSRFVCLFAVWLVAGIYFCEFAPIHLENGADDDVRLVCALKSPVLAAAGFSYFDPWLPSDYETFMWALAGIVVLIIAFLSIPGKTPAIFILLCLCTYMAYGLASYDSVLRWWATHGHG